MGGSVSSSRGESSSRHSRYLNIFNELSLETGSNLHFLQFCNGDRYYGPIDSDGIPGGGNGLILYRDGSAFVGGVLKGKRSGRGTFIHGPSDVQYDGGWVEDKWDGDGILFSVHDQTILKGTWKLGELVDEGSRYDFRTRITWAETYDHGQLVSQRILQMSPKSNASTSSSRTSRQSSEERISPPRTSQSLETAPVDPSDVLPDVAGPSAPSIQAVGRNSLTDSIERCGIEGQVAPSVLRSRRTSRSFFRLGAVSSIVGSPSFLNYCSPPNTALKESTERRCSLPENVLSPRMPNMALNSIIPGDLSNYSLARVVSWTTDDVLLWLKSFDAPPAVVDAFRRHEVTGSSLLTNITRESLKRDIGIFPFGYRAKVMEHLKLLKLQVCFAEEAHSSSSSMIITPLPPLSSRTTQPLTTDRPSRPPNSARPSSSPRQHSYRSRPSRLPELAPSSATTNFYIPFHQLEFHEKLGLDSTSMSSVFRGRWLGKEIAIKVFTGWLVDEEAWAHYVQSLIDLRHPNLILVLGVSRRAPDLHCVVMEYAAHQSLQDLMHGSELPHLLDSWANVPFGDSVCGQTAFGQLLVKLGFQGRRIPTFHKHENRGLVTVTSDEAGSCMPINPYADGDRCADEGMATLALGKTEYPATSSICSHIDDYLTILLPASTAHERDTHEHLDWRRLSRSSASQSPKRKEESTKERLTNTLVLSIAKGIVLGCIYLNQKSVYHLNLKPSNVLIDESFHVKLTDFGQATLAEAFTNAPLYPPMPPRSTSTAWSSNLIPAPSTEIRCRHCGYEFDAAKSAVVEATTLRARRLNWCAPEVLRMPLRYHGWDDHSDVYSFGLILWEMLTGRAPLIGLGPTHMRVAVGYSGLRAPLARVWLPLQRLLAGCLAFMASDRPSFAEILFTLVNIHQFANTAAEEALIAFIQGVD